MQGGQTEAVDHEHLLLTNIKDETFSNLSVVELYRPCVPDSLARTMRFENNEDC